jgi:SAM-dependent methyltransferase
MYEILKNLSADSLVLDLGCAKGSFPREATHARVVRVDRDWPGDTAGGFVRADAGALPFADGTFAAVISNHSLEHFDDLGDALKEIGRVIRPGGSLFVAVPDASTLTDKLYRWLARGGGHVNAFTSSGGTAALIEQGTGLPHVATRVICSSLSFLNRHNSPLPRPRRLMLLGAGYEWSLFVYGWVSRRLDRYLGTRTSIYGWAFYFGNLAEAIDTATWVNVCCRCGSGSAASRLKELGLVRANFSGFRIFECPTCGAGNSFADDY